MLRIFLSISLVLTLLSLKAEIRSMWVPIWDMKSPELIDTLLKDASENGINQLLVQIRYRGDALYNSNNKYTTFKNKERRSYILDDSAFDPLGYIIKKAKKYNIEIHAWVTVFVVTPHDLKKLQPDHVYYTNPEWITADKSKNKMSHNSYEGAYLDPGIPEVRTYLLNVMLDIVFNYDIAGIHLDYIRYPNAKYGYNPIAVQKFISDCSKLGEDSCKNWSLWKQKQVNEFVKELYTNVKNISPDVKVTAAVIADPKEAKHNCSQNWVEWLNNDYIDAVYLMAYATKNTTFQRIINTVSNFNQNDKIIVGVRAWSENSYPVNRINEKIKYSKTKSFAGIALYSYSGIIKNNYFKDIKL